MMGVFGGSGNTENNYWTAVVCVAGVLVTLLRILVLIKDCLILRVFGLDFIAVRTLNLYRCVQSLSLGIVLGTGIRLDVMLMVLLMLVWTYSGDIVLRIGIYLVSRLREVVAVVILVAVVAVAEIWREKRQAIITLLIPN